MKIAHKLLVVLLLTSLLPVLGSGLFSYYSAQKALHNQLLVQVNDTATHQANSLETALDRVNVRLNNFTSKAQPRLLLDEYNKGDKHAQAVLNTVVLPGLLQEDLTFKRIHLLNPAGKVVASTDSSAVGHDFGHEEVLAKGQTSQNTDIFFKDADGYPRQYLEAPLKLEGQFIGYVVIEGSIDEYLLITQDYSALGNTGESYLVRKLPGGKIQYLTPLRFKPEAILTTVSNAALGAKDYRGQVVLTAKKNLVAEDWTLVTKIDEAEISAPLLHLRQSVLIILAVTIVAAVLAAWYFAEVITAPIKRFTEVVTKIRQGDLSQRVKNASGDEIGLLGNAFNDMTDSFLESQARLRASIGSLPFGFAIINLDDQIVFSNEVFKRLMKSTVAQDTDASQITIKQISDSFQPTIDILDKLHKVQSTRHLIEKNISHGPHYYRVLFIPIINQVNQIIGSVFIMEDTSEKRALERSRDEFFSIASHELRTPLTAIRGNSGMMLDYYHEQLKDPDLNQMVSDIHDASMRLIDIVNDFLDMSRLEMGKIEFKSEAFDAAELIGQILRELDVTGSRKKLALNLKTPDKDVPEAYGDKARVRQILINLISNAVKLTEKGGVTVTLQPCPTGVKISVTDTGKGIPEAQQHLLFRKFQQAGENTLTRDSTRSTGLGLYISKMLVESMNGKIYLEHTEVGKGSTFVVELPAASSSQKAITIEKPRQNGE